MRYYPLFLDLSRARVLLAGAGEVGRRKAGDILAAGPASLLWLDPAVDARDLPEALRLHPAVEYARREAVPEDAEGCALVFAASGSAGANHRLALFCRERGIPCNVADAPEEGDFIVPSHFHDGAFALALSTGGQSPALARIMRRELQAWYAEHYRPLLLLLGRLRQPALAEGNDAGSNRDLFRAVAGSGLGAALRRKDGAAAGRILREILPETLHKHIEDLLHGLY
ncbi:MAG: bifunctional precorrin-2 dehydrogenase/sirohydrochlorin ferrochelatase [Deltaproteobacteria bacterium]|jgi:precorrin-2 dehydrogenase/sirohydrochlorin ferrochelatase|nr:bifunctional precorrin-2 dehydrogenase/sirohydrochlorin ferrochelatase [Deltaproteobacteria bacterium]